MSPEEGPIETEKDRFPTNACFQGKFSEGFRHICSTQSQVMEVFEFHGQKRVEHVPGGLRFLLVLPSSKLT